MKRFASLMILLLCSTAYGQIDMPDKLDAPGMELVATVKAQVPEGAAFEGGWKISCIDGAACSATFRDLREPNTIGIWTKDPGTYNVSYSGFWLLLKEVKFKDGDGNEIVITSYLGHGMVTESASVVVGTPVPPPPPPPPTPEGPWQIWYFENPDQRDNLPQSQQALLVSQQYRADLVREGHIFKELVQPPSITSPPTRLGPVVTAYKAAGIKLPAVAIASTDGGEIRVYPLPMNWDDLKALLDSPPEVTK